jgi:hypothetical protein
MNSRVLVWSMKNRGKWGVVRVLRVVVYFCYLLFE